MQEVKQKTTAAIDIEYAANIKAGMPEELAIRIKQDATRQMELNLAKNRSTVVMQGIDFAFGSLEEAYKGNVDGFTNTITRQMADLTGEWSKGFGGTKEDLRASFYAAAAQVPDSLMKEASALCKAMEPQTQELERIAQQYRDAGMMPPKNILEGISQANQMKAIAGEVDGFYAVMGEQIANSPEALAALEAAKAKGDAIPQELIRAVELNKGMVYDSASGVWSQITTSAEDITEPMLTFLNEKGGEFSTEAANGIAANYGLMYNAGTNQWIAISDAALENQESVKAALSQCGLETTDELVNSILNAGSDVKKTTAGLLQQIATATEEEKEPLLLKLAGEGFDITSALGNGMLSNYEFVRNASTGMVDVIDGTTGEKIASMKGPMATKLVTTVGGAIQSADEYAKKHPVQVKGNGDGITNEADKWYNKLQSFFDRHPVLARFAGYGSQNPNAYPSIYPYGTPGYANGGYVDREQLAWIAEGNKPEMVIPLSAGQRTRAVGLWEQAGATLGMLPAAGNSYPAQRMYSDGLDYDRMADRVVEALRQTPIEVRPEITVQEGGVYLDAELAGRQLAPVISCKLTKNKKLIGAIAIAAGIIIIFVAISIRVAFQDESDTLQSINEESSLSENIPLQLFPLEFKAMVMEKDVPELEERISSLIHFSGELKAVSLDIEYKEDKVDKVNYDSVRVMYLTCSANETKLIVSCTIYKDQWAINSIKNGEDKNIVYLSKSIEEGEALYDFSTGKVIMTYEEQESKKEEANKKKEEESRKQEENQKNQYISECGSYSYKEIARRPQDYKGKKAKFTGKVMQVSKEYSGYMLLVQVTKSKYGYEDIVYVEYKPKDADESNVLEDDIVTIYGELGGERTYQSTVGKSITVPLFQCEYITILSE